MNTFLITSDKILQKKKKIVCKSLFDHFFLCTGLVRAPPFSKFHTILIHLFASAVKLGMAAPPTLRGCSSIGSSFDLYKGAKKRNTEGDKKMNAWPRSPPSIMSELSTEAAAELSSISGLVIASYP